MTTAGNDRHEAMIKHVTITRAFPDIFPTQESILLLLVHIVHLNSEFFIELRNRRPGHTSIVELMGNDHNEMLELHNELIQSYIARRPLYSSEIESLKNILTEKPLPKNLKLDIGAIGPKWTRYRNRILLKGNIVPVICGVGSRKRPHYVLVLLYCSFADSCKKLLLMSFDDRELRGPKSYFTSRITRVCIECGVSARLRCSGCACYYCGRKCQISSWTNSNHAKLCNDYRQVCLESSAIFDYYHNNKTSNLEWLDKKLLEVPRLGLIGRIAYRLRCSLNDEGVFDVSILFDVIMNTIVYHTLGLANISILLFLANLIGLLYEYSGDRDKEYRVLEFIWWTLLFHVFCTTFIKKVCEILFYVAFICFAGR